MDPKVTLIGEPWATRTMVFGKRKYVFVGGVPRNVPVSVALVCKKRVDNSGNPIFKIEGMPKIIKAVHPPIENIIQASIEKETPRQRRLV